MLLVDLFLVALIAALAAWGLFHNSRAIRHNRWLIERDNYIRHSNFERQLKELRHEIESSIESAREIATRSATVGDKVIAAVTPIEITLRDLAHQIIKLRERADATDEFTAKLDSSLRSQAEDRVNSFDRMNVRQEIFEQQLMSVSGQLYNLKKLVEELALGIERGDEVKASLAAMKSKIDSLSKLGSSRFEDLAIRVESTAKIVDEIESSYRQIGQDPAALYTRLPQTLSAVGDNETDPEKVSASGKPSMDGLPNNGETESFEMLASTPTLDLVATRVNDVWEIFAELESIDPSKVSLVQGIKRLLPCGRSDSLQFGPLRDLTTPLRLLDERTILLERLLLTPDSPLFFHIQRGGARSVIRASRGLNLAVIPSRWSCECADLPVAVEACAVDGYAAYLFSIERNPILTFSRPGAGPVTFSGVPPALRLDGRDLADAEREMGPLLVGDPPVLVGNDDVMGALRTVVLASLGTGTEKWRKAYEISANRIEGWPLPGELSTRGAGLYLVRAYDADGDLIDSFPFRYAAGLKSIHSPMDELKQRFDMALVQIEFTHDVGILVKAIEPAPPDLERYSSESTTEFVWPCHPNVSDVSFEVRVGGGSINLTLDVDRIWWAVSNGTDAVNLAWNASPVCLGTDDFSRKSEANLTIRFPRSPTIRAFVGFTREQRREVVVDTKGMAVLPLRELNDIPADDQVDLADLRLWVSCGSELELCVARLDQAKIPKPYNLE